MAVLNFTAVKGGYESEWFQPNNPFQLDLVFPESDLDIPVRIYSANDNDDSKPRALASEIALRHTQHLNMPVFKVIPGAGVYYKVFARLMPISASYLTE